MFFQQLPGLNNWKFIFTISPKEHLSVRMHAACIQYFFIMIILNMQAAVDQFNYMKKQGYVQLNPDTMF